MVFWVHAQCRNLFSYHSRKSNGSWGLCRRTGRRADGQREVGWGRIRSVSWLADSSSGIVKPFMCDTQGVVDTYSFWDGIAPTLRDKNCLSGPQDYPSGQTPSEEQMRRSHIEGVRDRQDVLHASSRDETSLIVRGNERTGFARWSTGPLKRLRQRSPRRWTWNMRSVSFTV